MAILVQIIITHIPKKCLEPYINEIVDILQVLVVDPSGEVILEGCEAIFQFCGQVGELAHNFSKILGNSLFSSITHKVAKVRISGLKALDSVLKIGAYKYNPFIFEGLIGFRDPNLVPIKDFYEPSTKLNYLAILSKDPNPNVRLTFYGYLGSWLTKLTDKYNDDIEKIMNQDFCLTLYLD